MINEGIKQENTCQIPNLKDEIRRQENEMIEDEIRRLRNEDEKSDFYGYMCVHN